MRKALLVVGVLLLGLRVNIEAKHTEFGSRAVLEGNLPGLGVLMVAVVWIVVAYRMFDHLPGVFALQHPLGKVRSGFDYLWSPLILASVVGFTWTGPLDPAKGEVYRYIEFKYGTMQDAFGMAAVGFMVLLLLTLKLRAAMILANERLCAQS